MFPFDDVIVISCIWPSDLPNPLHWRHMGAMTSQVTGNSTDCSAAPSGRQVRRQVVHIADPL